MFGALSSATADQRGHSFPFNDGGTYGIDVSHYGGHIDWPVVAKTDLKSVYIKASQGHTYVDAKFVYNITHARREGLPVGAYHFFSAGTSAKVQAEHFIDVYKPHRTAGDLVPALDLEWDPARHSGNDRWANHSASEIVSMVQEWVTAVESAFGVTPIIYTNKSWWEGRIGSHGAQLKKYKIWIANYSHHGNTPPMMDGFDWVMWQFTGNGHIDGINTVVDISLMNPNSSATHSTGTNTASGSDTGTTPQPPKPVCKIPATAAVQVVLTKEELASLFGVIRDQFGELDDTQVTFFNVMVNTASPRMLRSLIAGGEQPMLTAAEQRDFFDVARSKVGGGHLTAGQVSLLNSLIQTADAAAVRDCIIR